MDKKEEEFFKLLQATFKVEAEEHLKEMSAGLLELESAPTGETRAAILEVVFREAHSLKGAARAVNSSNVETVCQSLESIFAAMKRGEINPMPKLLDMLHQAVDTISNLVSSPETVRISITEIVKTLERLAAESHETPAMPQVVKDSFLPAADEPILYEPESPSSIEAIVSEPQPPVEAASPVKVNSTRRSSKRASQTVDRKSKAVVSTSNGHKKSSKSKPDAPQPAPQSDTDSRQLSPVIQKGHTAISETVSISTSKLDSVLLQTEEMLSVKLMANQMVADLKGVSSSLDLWKKEWTRLYPEMQKVRQIVEAKGKRNGEEKAHSPFSKVLEFLDWNRAQIKIFEERLGALTKSAERDDRSVGGMVDNLLEDTKNLLLLPFSTLLSVFPRMARDLSRDLGKEVELQMKGSEVEIDKRILEEMKDPLTHLLRNCVDHGIENPDTRKRNNKPACGKITIAVSQVNGNKVEITISDDGGGIDAEKVKAAAMRNGLLTDEEADDLTQQEAIQFIFQSAVSTSPIITDISGRGLGMAIAREKVEKLMGQIAVESRLGEGTLFRILLPLTMATFRGILIRLSDRVFVIPTGNVERVARIRRDEIKTVGNKETIILDGLAVSLARLGDVLEIPGVESKSSDFKPVLVLGSGDKRIAFMVDEVLNEQEVLVKTLGKQLSRVRNIAGATVLGSGKVAPILNASDLMKSTMRASLSSTSTMTQEDCEEKPLSILVAEDSITSRTLLKNTLESAGYQVTTAVDGVDAFTKLKIDAFDLVVSDVEMPRMSGFELTAKMRGDQSLAQVPVILVTSLDSREDRERGVDAGANAYIVKSSFDQSNLLEVIGRLI